MARIEPGLYEPADDAHVFDGMEDDGDDEGSRLPLLIVIALLVLAAFAGVVWLAYTQGVQRGRQDVPRLIAAENTPVKTAPKEQASADNPVAGLKIYQNKAPVDPQVAEQEHHLPSIITQPGEPLFSAFGPQKGAAEAAKAAAARNAAQPAAQAPAPVAPAMRPATPEPKAGPVKPAPVKPAPVKPEPIKPVQSAVVAPPKPVQSVPPAAMAAPLAGGGGAFVAQIAAFKSQAEAQAGWNTFRSKHGGLLGGYGPNIIAVDLGEKGIWYRVRTGSFPDRASASAFCDRLKAQGASCMPAKG